MVNVVVVVIMVVALFRQRQADAAIFATTIHSVKANNVAFRFFLFEISAMDLEQKEKKKNES